MLNFRPHLSMNQNCTEIQVSTKLIILKYESKHSGAQQPTMSGLLKFEKNVDTVGNLGKHQYGS